MATGPTLTEVQLPPRDANFNTGSRFLSKITRSPTSSQRHRPIPSQGSDTVPDFLSTAVNSTQGASNSRRNQPRPGFQRQISAPDPFVVQLPYANENEPKHHSDATRETASRAADMLQKHQLQPTSSQSSMSAKGPPQSAMSSAPLVSEHYVHPPASNGVHSAQPALNYMYQQICDLSQKRITTLKYLRKTHEGKIFWFNTVHLSKSDVTRIPSYTPNRSSRRASNYFLLGISIPAVLDIHQTPHPNSPTQAYSAVALEYLKSLNILLTEFENYQERHPTDGSHVGSLGRPRLPSMFKRSATVSRPRKSSTAPSIEIGAQISPPAVPDSAHHQLHHSAHPSIDTTASVAVPSISSAASLGNAPSSFGANGPMTAFGATATFPPPGPTDAPNSSLLPNEAAYTHLLTPPLPFAPDFYTVFATLCDVLIDTYQRFLQIINNPNTCSATIVDMFSKTDAKIRKVIVGGILRDFETAARDNAKRELAGVQKVVLGALMG